MKLVPRRNAEAVAALDAVVEAVDMEAGVEAMAVAVVGAEVTVEAVVGEVVGEAEIAATAEIAGERNSLAWFPVFAAVSF